MKAPSVSDVCSREAAGAVVARLVLRGASVAAGVALFSLALAPTVARWREGRRLARAVAATQARHDQPGQDSTGWTVYLPSAESTVQNGSDLMSSAASSFLASWQAVGGCGAGAGSSTGAGVKWIGRSVTGGLFNVQQQFMYTKLGTSTFPEYNYFSNTLITADITEKWSLGVNIPVIYRYLVDPNHIGGPGSAPVDYSNGGLGDVSAMVTRKFGDINDTLVTAIAGIPTGEYKASYVPGGTPINQSQQLGFGKPTASLVVDHVLDQVWGLVVVGGAASWRGGENSVHNYRAPSATVYSYAGYFWGSLVPAFGLAATGLTGHDRDQDAEQYSPLAILSANVSLEWSTDWFAVLLAASLPYRYDALTVDDNHAPRSPFGFMPWTFAFGLAAAPF